MPLRIMASRHAAFYSPLIATMAGGFLDRHGLSAEYSVLTKGQRSSELIGGGAVDIMQSAVSSNWGPMERGQSPLPVHFAQINRRDGFFLVARETGAAFEWHQLAGETVLADHGAQPLLMLRYAARVNGLDWAQVDDANAGPPEEMVRAFREGRGQFVHLQSPAAHQLECDGVGRVAASVGASMPPVAFSSLCCSREFTRSEIFAAFRAAFEESRNWVRSAPAAEVAAVEARFFPGISLPALTAAIEAYQKLGCWEGDPAIPRDLYEQALDVFETGGRLPAGSPTRTSFYELGVPEHVRPGNLVRAMAVGWHQSAPAILRSKLILRTVASHTPRVVAAGNFHSRAHPPGKCTREHAPAAKYRKQNSRARIQLDDERANTRRTSHLQPAAHRC